MTILMSQQDNGRYEPIPAVTSQMILETTASRPSGHVVRVRLEKLATGCWSVQAVAGGRGGLFRDHASATKFIRREFAARQRTVVETLSA
jgi:hypothetical protein